MKQKIIACALVLAMLAGMLCTALADTTYNARTPLDGDSDKLRNIKLAAEAIDGTELEYGESFSFNDTVGNNAVSVIIE